MTGNGSEFPSKKPTCRSLDRLRPLHLLYMFKSMMYVPDDSMFSSYKKWPLEIQGKCSLHASYVQASTVVETLMEVECIWYKQTFLDVEWLPRMYTIHDNQSTKYNGNLI